MLKYIINKNAYTCDPEIPLLGIYPKNPSTPIQKNVCILMFTAALFTIAKLETAKLETA